MDIGSILIQDQNPIAYFSEKLNKAKKKYSSDEKQLYVVIHALKKWRHYLMPKELVFYTDNHALQFTSIEDKFNQRHVKLIEYMHNFTCVIKNISGQTNKLVDSLIRRCLILEECHVTMLGFSRMKEIQKDDLELQEIYASCENQVSSDRSLWIEYILQEGLSFRGCQ